jgi:hypothetical protein
LTSHHQGEDDGMFSRLQRERPDAARAVANLVEDHGTIASILSRVRELYGCRICHPARSGGVSVLVDHSGEGCVAF